MRAESVPAPIPMTPPSWRDILQASIEIPALVRLLGLPPHSRVLEIGCGRGNALGALAERCSPVRLAGIDLDRIALEKAELRLYARGTVAALVQADLRRLPFKNEAFDLVIDFGTLYHVKDAGVALTDIARVLATGGTLVYEKRFAQRLAHPLWYSGQSLPWDAVPSLALQRNAVVWASRVKCEATDFSTNRSELTGREPQTI
ncbi:MAG: class I SAM-dependent methyltransferase [Dehalococcoidia bacterium]